MVLVQQGPRDTGKEYPRIVEDASLPQPSFSCPFRDSFLSLSLFSSLSFFFLVVNMLRSVLLSGFIPRKGNRRLLQTLRREKGYRPRGFLSLSSFSLFSNGFRRGAFLLPFSLTLVLCAARPWYSRIAKSRALRGA